MLHRHSVINLICALQAYKYLREEVKTFQGKPIMVSQTTQFGKWQFFLFFVPSHILPLIPLPPPVCLASILCPLHPPQARIKAINTFFAKNGYRSMDSSLYAQQSQSQSQFSSPLYMPHVYPQQQYPVYGIVPPTWTPSPTPYFETPLVRDGYSTAHHFSPASSFFLV